MRLAFLALLLLASPVAAQPKQLPPELVAPTDALSPADERKAFTVPEGFDVQLVASEPEIQKPMQMAFDAKGRMWVTTSYHYPFAAAGKPTDKVFVLSDFDPATGKARKVSTFTSDLNIPIGVLPMPDGKSVIVSSVGEIRKYKITEAEGGPKADGFEVLFTGFGSRDTHGMYNSYTLMPDGWVYACHGFSNDSTVKGKDGHEVKMNSGNTFRFRPDGSRIEVYSRGQVNPFGMTVDPWFNLYTADCHSKPITQLIPGAYYDSFGKPHDGLGYAPHVTAHPHKSTGLCGLSWYDAEQFPKEYNGMMFLGDVVSNCISLDKIEWKGASPVAKEMPDFLTSKDRWFRPVDIKLGPDGALYVADFYNKIIGHYEVDLKHPGRDHDHGRIWRIVWKGKDGKAPAPKFAYADLTTAKGEVIDELLGHPNLMVRLLATNQAIHRTEDMQARDDKSEVYNAHRMWVDEARAWTLGKTDQRIQRAYRNDEPLLASHHYRIQRAVEEFRREHKSPVEVARQKVDLAKANPHVARAAVEMMAGNPKAEFVPALLEVLKKTHADDTHLRHAARVALRNCLRDDEKAWPAYKDQDALKKGFDPVYAEIAVSVPDVKAAEYLLTQIRARAIPQSQLVTAAEHIARHGEEGDWKLALAYFTSSNAAEYTATNGEAILGIFRSLQSRGKQLNTAVAGWVLSVVESQLYHEDPSDPSGNPNVPRLISVIRVLVALPPITEKWETVKLPVKLVKGLGEWTQRNDSPVDLRAASADALLRISPEQGYPILRKLIDDPKLSAQFHDRLLVVFASSGNREARLDARDALKDAPYRTAVAVGVALAGSPGGAQDLLDAVKLGKAPARLLQEKAILERLRAANIRGLDQQIAALTKGLPALDARLAELIKKRATAFASAKPDKELGAKLFAKHCAACHRIGDQGGKIAPQLDGIGNRGLERILEDVIDPNRNVDQAFRARIILTKDEKSITGLMLRVEGEVLVVADGEGKEIRIPTSDIASNRETMLSPMPANVGDIIPENEFPHLIAYLLDQKAKELPKKE